MPVIINSIHFSIVLEKDAHHTNRKPVIVQELKAAADLNSVLWCFHHTAEMEVRHGYLLWVYVFNYVPVFICKNISREILQNKWTYVQS